MFDWKEILKNQKTFQGLAIGEMTEDSLIDEDDRKCKPIVLRHMKRIQKLHDDFVKEFGDRIFDDFSENLSNPSAGGIYNVDMNEGGYFTIIFSIAKEDFDEEEACYLLDNLPKRGFSYDSHGYTNHTFGHDIKFNSHKTCAFVSIADFSQPAYLTNKRKKIADDFADFIIKAKEEFAKIFREART